MEVLVHFMAKMFCSLGVFLSLLVIYLKCYVKKLLVISVKYCYCVDYMLVMGYSTTNYFCICIASMWINFKPCCIYGI